MGSVLVRAFSFTLVVVIGIFLRSMRLVPEDAGESAKKFLINITLPAVIITNFSSIQSVTTDLLIVTFLGVLTNIVMIAAGMAVTKRREKPVQAMYMLCLPAYNIGAFCLPFIQNFLPAAGVVAACMFDVGNSVMCTGGTYAFVAEYTAGEENANRKMDMGAFAKRLLTSPPLVTYVVMFLLSAVHFEMPEVILTLIDPMAKANTFVAMLMLGLLFHMEFKKEYWREIVRIVGMRYFFAVVSALVFYYFLPFDLVIRQTLVMVSFAPMSIVAPAYTGMCHGDEGMASCANSVTILCSLAVITGLLVIMGLY